MRIHRQQWDQSLKDALTGCQGEVLAEAWVDEMGLYGPDEGPSFTHPKLEFVQALTLELRFESGGTLQIRCWQDDDEFALWPKRASVEARLSPLPDPSRTLFRVRPMKEFPGGQVRHVEWQPDKRGNIQLICLRLDNGEALLRAGEVYEDHDGSLTVKDRDESVLIFVDRAAYERTVFNAPAYRIE
jgi:hypothetical protein